MMWTAGLVVSRIAGLVVIIVWVISAALDNLWMACAMLPLLVLIDWVEDRYEKHMRKLDDDRHVQQVQQRAWQRVQHAEQVQALTQRSKQLRARQAELLDLATPDDPRLN